MCVAPHPGPCVATELRYVKLWRVDVVACCGLWLLWLVVVVDTAMAVALPGLYDACRVR